MVLRNTSSAGWQPQEDIMHGFRIWCCATSHQQRVATPRRHHAWLQDMMLRNISSAEVGNPKKRSCSQALHQGLPGQLQCILLRARNACPHVMSCSQALHRVFLASSRSSCTLLGCHVHKPSIKVFLASSNASCTLLGSLAPACASCGLPPPPPPQAFATDPTTLPACSPISTTCKDGEYRMSAVTDRQYMIRSLATRFV
eukprot:335955-Pelagomonas_calceolata.AAC.3